MAQQSHSPNTSKSISTPETPTTLPSSQLGYLTADSLGCLYECRVFHRRFSPRTHQLTHSVFMFMLDVDKLPHLPDKIPFIGVNSPGLYSFWNQDHFTLSPTGPRDSLETFLSSEGCYEKPARILLLTNLRFLGYTFNPISVWFCFRHDGSPIAAVAEVGNTFGELKPFLIPWDGRHFARRTKKHFYVSPFSPLDLEFDFRFHNPGHQLRLQVDDYQDNHRTLTSSLTGRPAPLDFTTLSKFTLKYPLITLKVIFLIHWHALLIWLKKVPFHYKESNPHLQTGVFRPRR